MFLLQCLSRSMEIWRILSRDVCISLTFTVSSLIIKTLPVYSFFSLPRFFPPGHFFFLVPVSRHPARAVPGRGVLRKTLPGEHTQALFLPRRLPGIGTADAEVHRKALALARRSTAAALCSSVNGRPFLAGLFPIR